jgi:hypothetical protein
MLLTRARIRISQGLDTLVWSYNEARGVFTAKLGYKETLTPGVEENKMVVEKKLEDFCTTEI